MFETIVLGTLGILTAILVFPLVLSIGVILGVGAFYVGMFLTGVVIIILATLAEWVRGWFR